jgi:hypothetical protein
MVRTILDCKWKIAGAVLGAALFAIGVMLGSLCIATRHVPDFYRQALVPDVARDRQASDELLESATAIANSANRPGPWYVSVTEEQINGWLAVDLVQNHADLLPPNLVDPRVRIEAGRARIACGYRCPGLSTVISVTFDLYLAEPHVVALRIHAARAGSLPVPIKPIVDGVAQMAERLNLRVDWRQAHGDPVALITLPPAHGEGAVYRLDALHLREREIYLAGRTDTVPKSESPSPASATPQPDVAARPDESRNVH